MALTLSCKGSTFQIDVSDPLQTLGSLREHIIGLVPGLTYGHALKLLVPGRKAVQLEPQDPHLLKDAGE